MTGIAPRPSSAAPRPGGRSVPWRLAVLAALAIATCAGAGIARGESSASGNLVVSLQGHIAPHALPRDRPAPITVHVAGAIKTSDGTAPPALRRITIALNRSGKLFTKGLPTCTAGALEATTTSQAHSICGPALIGGGQFESAISFPNTAPFPVEGKLLIFNAVLKHRPGILLHIYGAEPAQHTFVVPMTISHRRSGTFGTVVSAAIPTLAGGLGHVTDINLELGRKFRYKGQAHSLLSASCAAPPGFPGAIFTFAEGKFTFDDGTTVSPSLTRDCKVRE
jgi:hypothetical protein